MSASFPKATASMRTVARGFASSARIHAEAATSAPVREPRPQSNLQSQRSSPSGIQLSDRLRSAQRSRASPQQNGQNSTRNAGGERRNKRLPSVFDPASVSAHPTQATSIKSVGQYSQKLPAPMPSTDWNSALFSKPGFERLLAPAPRPSSIFTPNLSVAVPSTPAAAAKGKGKAAAASAKVASAKLNLPGIKTAASALKLHIRPGGRNILGPINNPTGVAAGSLSQNRVPLAPSFELKGSDDSSLAAELKAARIALQNEQIGGSYQRFAPQSVLNAAGVQPSTQGVPTHIKAVQDAAQALALNADIAPEGKGFVVKSIAERLSA